MTRVEKPKVKYNGRDGTWYAESPMSGMILHSEYFRSAGDVLDYLADPIPSARFQCVMVSNPAPLEFYRY